MGRAHWSELPEEWSDDEKLAGDFLAGWLEQIDGRIVHKYFEPGSDEEREAQAALVRCLWDWHNPQRTLQPAIRVRLAALFDPTCKEEDRRIAIEWRRRPHSTRRAWISTLMAGQVATERKQGRNFETAIENAAKDFGVSESTIKRALPPSQRKLRSRRKK